MERVVEPVVGRIIGIRAVCGLWCACGVSVFVCLCVVCVYIAYYNFNWFVSPSLSWY